MAQQTSAVLPTQLETPNHPVAVSLIHDAPASLEANQINVTYKAISDLLTRDSAYTPQEITALGLPKVSVVVSRAIAVRVTLSEITALYEARLSGDPTQTELLGVIKSNNEAEMKKRGLDFSYAQFDEVLAAFLAGNPPVDIETVGPYLAAHINQETGGLEIKMENVPVEEAVGIQMAAVFKRLTHSVQGRVRIVALLDEFNNYVSERGFTEAEQDAYVAAIAELFGQAGVIEPNDEAGKDFLLLRESEQINKVDGFVERLRLSGNGEVRTNEDGELVFMPNQEFIAVLKLSSNRRKEFRKKGIALREADGKPLCQALDAAGFLGDENKYLMHLVMLENHMTAQQDKVFALLKALGITNEQKYHNVFFDAENLPPDVIVYGITKKLQHHVEKLIGQLQDAHNTSIT